MATVNEGSTAYLSVSFSDKAGAPAQPDAVSYRIDCVTTGQVVLAETPLAPAASVEIVLTPTYNAILAAGNRVERKRVTVVASYGAADAVNDAYDYHVRNLAAVA